MLLSDRLLGHQTGDLGSSLGTKKYFYQTLIVDTNSTHNLFNLCSEQDAVFLFSRTHQILWEKLYMFFDN